MRLFSNKPFLILAVINIIYVFNIIDTHRLIKDTKSSIKTALGDMGVEKYKNRQRLESKDLVIYFNMDKSLKIDKVEKKSEKSSHFLDDKVIHEPSFYQWGGDVYDLRNEGYYYLVDFKRGIDRNIIIYKNDIFSLMSSLSWLVVHGSNDDRKSFDNKYSKLLNNKLSLTCGDLSSFASSILDSLNIENRVVHFFTMDEKNSYDNGHVLIEAKVDNQYILFDLDNNQYFKTNERILSAKDFIDNTNWDAIEFVKLSIDSNTDSQNFYSGNISFHGFMDYVNSNIKAWYKRVLQVPLIVENDIAYVGLSDKQSEDSVLDYHPKAVILTKDEFNKKFYGEK